MRAAAFVLLVLILSQFYIGALVAGLRAGLIYNTWPLIDGSFIPDGAHLWHETPAWRNLFENTLTVQFNHRTMAYLLWALALLHALDVALTLRRGPVVTSAMVLAAAITIQAALGILTLLHQVPIALALAHQAVAIMVLAVATLHAARLAVPVAAAMEVAEQRSR
jgi:cytochrome c oxidase assembly protein subunit 15